MPQLRKFFPSPTAVVMDLFIGYRNIFWYAPEICEITKLNPRTVKKTLNKLESEKLIKHVGGRWFFNDENPRAMCLYYFNKTP